MLIVGLRVEVELVENVTEEDVQSEKEGVLVLQSVLVGLFV